MLRNKIEHKTYKHFLRILPLLFAVILGCKSVDNSPLPILGRPEFVNDDTIYPKIRPFEFINQDSASITNDYYKGKIRVVDFFFTSCPTICPTLAKQMKRIYDHYEGDNRVMLLSHTIDTKHDTIPALKSYADKIGVSSEKWSFVTGEKDSILSIDADYLSIALEDSDAPGGFDHSGNLILVDDNGYVRSFCMGTNPEEVDRLIVDIAKLLKEYED